MATEYVDWSEQPIYFSRDDHPPSVPRPGHAALVVEAQIGGFNMGKILMDGGSGLNLLFANTAKVMGIPPRSFGKDRYAVPRRYPNVTSRTPRQDIPRSHLRQTRQLQEGTARVQSRRHRVTMPRNPWSTNFRQVHGSATLHVPEDEDAWK